MRQYTAIKARYPGTMLFYRMGDFYEMFYEDAVTASRVLGLTLTSRDRDPASGKEIPLAGFPYHALEQYLGRMVKAGHKVAICEQTEDPKKAKGIVKRDVIRVVTPGTVLESSLLPSGANNFIASVVKLKGSYGLALIDISTGEFMVTHFEGADSDGMLLGELTRFRPSEIVVPTSLSEDSKFTGMLATELSPSPTISTHTETSFLHDMAAASLQAHFSTVTLDGMGLGGMVTSVMAAGGLLDYIGETQKGNVPPIDRIRTYSTGNYMILDATTLRNLELMGNMRDGSSAGSLIRVLDRTLTSSGTRTLRKWMVQPLMDPERIVERLDALQVLSEDLFLRHDIREILKKIHDMERIVTRVLYGSANARDVVSLSSSLSNIPPLIKLLGASGKVMATPFLSRLLKELDPLDDVCALIDEALVEDPPLTVREGKMIRDGASSGLDELRQLSRGGKEWVKQLQERLKRQLGIRKVKVGFNKVFGYYIEIPKAAAAQVPADYIRKQTVASGERYISEELKEMEAKILSAEDRSVALEYELFCSIREEVAAQSERVRLTARATAAIDALASLAEVAVSNGYCRPDIATDDLITIKGGRHPVVESISQEGFVPNDTLLDRGENRLMIITGPNMAGKSTYMRQVALITLMAQMGSFVPAKSAHIGITDRIFTRVGAHDDLYRGRSTFMVEMVELANILNNATTSSLILLDEIGRGTSTFDGLSIAWAVCEYLHDPGTVGARTMFATHYHQLTDIEKYLDGVRNYNVLVREREHSIVFLRKIAPGSTDRSYGIEVARIAGVPAQVTERAKEVLSTIEDHDSLANMKDRLVENGKKAVHGPAVPLRVPEVRADGRARIQTVLFAAEREEDPLRERVRQLNLDSMSPLDALQILYDMKKQVDEP